MQLFIARPFNCTNPGEECLGVILGWMADNLKSDVICPVMKKHGLETFDPERWYSTQDVLGIVRDLCKEPDTMNIFIAIGKKFAEEYPFPANVKTLPEAVLAFNDVYHTLHRGIHPDEGFLVEEPQSNKLIVTNNTPWPGELIFGILFALGNRSAVRHNFKVTLLAPDDHLRAKFEVTWTN